MLARRGSRKGGSASFSPSVSSGFVGGEARAVGGDLEQDAVRLAEIEAAEIEAIDLAAVRHAQGVRAAPPRRRTRLVRRAERDVVHAAGALLGRRQAGLDRDVQLGRRAALAHLVDMDLARRSGRVGARGRMFISLASTASVGAGPAR